MTDKARYGAEGSNRGIPSLVILVPSAYRAAKCRLAWFQQTREAMRRERDAKVRLLLGEVLELMKEPRGSCAECDDLPPLHTQQGETMDNILAIEFGIHVWDGLQTRKERFDNSDKHW